MLNRRTILSILIFFLFLFFGCATNREISSDTVTVAVWDIEDLSYDGSSRQDIGQVLSGEIIESLKTYGKYKVVERQRLLLVLEELNLGSSDLADENTRLHIGRIFGASYMVFGGYQIIGNAMRIDLRLVDVSSGKIIHAAQSTTSSSSLSGWMTAARDAANELIMK